MVRSGAPSGARTERVQIGAPEELFLQLALDRGRQPGFAVGVGDGLVERLGYHCEPSRHVEDPVGAALHQKGVVALGSGGRDEADRPPDAQSGGEVEGGVDRGEVQIPKGRDAGTASYRAEQLFFEEVVGKGVGGEVRQCEMGLQSILISVEAFQSVERIVDHDRVTGLHCGEAANGCVCSEHRKLEAVAGCRRDAHLLGLAAQRNSEADPLGTAQDCQRQVVGGHAGAVGAGPVAVVGANRMGDP